MTAWSRRRLAHDRDRPSQGALAARDRTVDDEDRPHAGGLGHAIRDSSTSIAAVALHVRHRVLRISLQAPVADPPFRGERNLHERLVDWYRYCTLTSFGRRSTRRSSN